MSYQKNCDRSDAGSARRAKKWREHLYRRSAFRLRTKDCIQTILFVKYLHKLRRIFIEGMGGGELQGISSEYVFAAICAQAFKRRKVKANRLKSESINNCAIGKLRSVAK